MKRIVFLTTSDAWPGFLLSGTEQLIAGSENAEALLNEQVADASVGLVVIDERLRPHLSDELLERIDKNHPGKVTILPSPLIGESSLALDIIKQAIGYHVRFRQ